VRNGYRSGQSFLCLKEKHTGTPAPQPDHKKENLMTEIAHYAPTQTPATQSLDSMMRVADMLAASDLVPAAYRRKPANVLVATLAGQAFGWDPTMAMRSFHIIEGVPSVKPEVMLALVRQAGHSVTGSTSVEGATITGVRRDTADTMSFSFGPAEAKAAGLSAGKNYQKYAASMYWARALSQLCRMLFPDVVLGAGYTPEELGASVSEDGAPVETVAVRQAAPASETTIATTKRAMVAAYVGAGFEREEGITYAAAAWERAGLAGATDPLTDDQVAAAMAAVDEDLHPEIVTAEIVEEEEL
jgi:hypothetical protein